MFDDMPKVELHLHLEGALPPRTVLQLATRNGLLDLLPGATEEAIARWYVFRDFYHFMEIVRTIKMLLRTPEDFALAVYAAGQELAAQRVRYAEITVTPYTYIGFLNQGVTLDTILQGLEAGRQQVLAKFGIELRWIFDIPRNRAFADYHNGGDYVVGAAERTLEFALSGKDYGVIGLGLGGNEVNAPPQPFAHVFAEAKRYGLMSVPHAGESAGASSVWGAIDDLQADRVGHGVHAIEDSQLVRELAERQIPLEVNLTSNIYLNFYSRLEEHPLPLLDRAGVLLTVNTDDPTLIGTTLSREYQLLVDAFGYSRADVLRIARNAFIVCGADPATKTRLLMEFDEWAAKET
ncbi:MAG: adenosine deaminase [Chloroflexota bacterium]